jgi:hypothetical protein
MVVDCTLEWKGDWGEAAGASPQPKSETGELATETKIEEKGLVREFCKIMQDVLAA